MEGSQSTGRVEICFNQRWGTIVDDLWDSVDTSVACQEMGFTYSGTIINFYCNYYNMFRYDNTCNYNNVQE